MEQTITTLSAPSRITSSSNSFHPMMLCSTSTECTGRSSSARRTIAPNSSRL